MSYPATELVLDKNGNVYHLGFSPDDLADKIILVGDQDRVHQVSKQFDSVTHRSQHREFVCHTGSYQGKEISVLSTGIGTDNIDIVVNELDALKNIDLINRVNSIPPKKLTMVRIGTCGILQAAVPIHSYILSTAAVGLDNVAHFYPISFSTREEQLATEISAHINYPATIVPYATEASLELVAKLRSSKTYEGITMTSSGFYGPQGRKLRLGLRNELINEQLASFQFEEQQVLNFEMESSALFALGKALGHDCTTICLGIANRPAKEFSTDYTLAMDELIHYVLDRI